MFQKLVNHNDDIRHLVEKGCAVAFDSNYMVIRDIPYLDDERKLQTGTIVTKLVFEDQEHVRQEDHQIFFSGSSPHNLEGKPIPNLGDRPAQLVLSEDCPDVVVKRAFSHKPRVNGNLQGYKDFFEKIICYINVISGPAIELYNATPFTFRVVKKVNADPVFKFHDTLTSRAEITDLSNRFKGDVIALIGLGGTGAYLLDFLVKMPVREIRAFDLDCFHVHNAYRSPGHLEETELRKPKVEVYQARYENFRSGLSFHAKFVDDSCVEDLEGVTFAFVCVDKGSSRAGIFDLLISKSIPFIDVGMGLTRKRGPISGQLRATYFSADHGQKVRDMNLAPLSDNPDDLYKTNIQISELNALNACLAIIKFKQLRGFYFEEVPYHHLLFEIGDLKIVGDSEDNEN